MSFDSHADEINLEFDEITLESKHLILNDDNLVIADGNVRLTAGTLDVRADLLRLDLKSKIAHLINPIVVGYGDIIIQGESLVLGHDGLELTKPKLQIHLATSDADRAICKNGTCILTNATGTTCPHKPAGFRIRAKKIVVHPNQDVDLHRPVLEIENLPIAILPWIRIRAPGKAGFLPPIIGWDKRAGAILGIAGWMPLFSTLSLQAEIAARTSQGLQGRAIFASSNARLDIQYLLDVPDSHLRARSNAFWSLGRSSMAVDMDLASNAYIIDTLPADPIDRAITHTRSDTLITMPSSSLLLTSAFSLIAPYDPRHPDIRTLSPSTTIALELPAVSIGSIFWPSADLRLTRFDNRGGTPGHTRFEFAPQIALSNHLGPLRFDARAASRHQLWLEDQSRNATQSNVFSSEAWVSVPLGRKFKRATHIFAPLARYRVTPLIHGTSPGWIMDDFDALGRGHGVEFGGVTDVLIGSKRFANITITERLNLPGFGRVLDLSHLAACAIVGPEQLSLGGDVAWDHDNKKPSVLSVFLSSQNKGAFNLLLGARWLGPGDGPHIDYPWSDSSGPWLVDGWINGPSEYVESFESFSLFLGARTTVHVDSRIQVWPKTSLNLLRYGVEMGSKCGCVSAGLDASHRPDSPIPDIMLNVRFVPPR